MPKMNTRLARDDPRETWALYTVSEAARYLDVAPSTLRTWVHPERGTPLVTSLPHEGHAPSIPFIGLAEAFVLAECKRRRMTPREIREGVSGIVRQFSVEHALAHRLIYTMQGSIALHHHGVAERARDQQLQILEIAREHAQLVDFGTDDYATRLTLPGYKSLAVSISPYVAAGAPVIGTSRVRVRDVLDRYYAKESFDVIAYDFGLSEEEVRELASVAAKRSTPRRAA